MAGDAMGGRGRTRGWPREEKTHGLRGMKNEMFALGGQHNKGALGMLWSAFPGVNTSRLMQVK